MNTRYSRRPSVTVRTVQGRTRDMFIRTRLLRKPPWFSTQTTRLTKIQKPIRDDTRVVPSVPYDIYHEEAPRSTTHKAVLLVLPGGQRSAAGSRAELRNSATKYSV